MAADASGRSRMWLVAGLLGLVGLSVWRLAAPATGGVDETPTTLAGATMGTRYSVKLARALTTDARQQADRATIEALATVERAASTYRDDSELSHFNTHRDITQPFAVSAKLRPIMEIAIDIGQRSGGALDVTVGPLVNAWGFGPHKRRELSADAISALRTRVGWHRLRLDDAGLHKRHPELTCDLSAVAKGYAVDRVAEALEKLGHRDFLVEIGGELRARGRRPDGQPWRVGIEKPVSSARAVQRVVPLRDAGMATSGDYRNFFEKDGRRHSHLIDPRTGQPIDHGLASVTVLHREVARADAWATALNVLGPVEGPEVADREGIAAFFLVREGPETFRSMETPAFTRQVGGIEP